MRACTAGSICPGDAPCRIFGAHLGHERGGFPTLAHPANSPESSMAERVPPRPTTIIDAPRLSARLGATVTLASETHQFTGSFKFRAASNVAFSVPHPHVITASSGNFGQAIAYACKLAGKRCTVVMPDNSAQVKVDAVREFGATLDLVATATTPRERRVAELAREIPDVYVASAYDDPLVINGNATLGRELHALGRPFDAVVVPVGGGGLSAGLVTGLKEMGSVIRVIGAEPAIANDGAQSLRAGHIIAFEREPQTIADGARTRSLGKHNWEILRTGLERMAEVPEDAIKETVRLLYLLANVKAEPTGALAVAAVLADPGAFRGQSVCCVVTGGNVDVSVYTAILDSRV
jgi:threonine dehydratase